MAVVVAILDLKIKMKSNDKINIRYEFLILKNPRKHMQISTISQNVEKLIFKMVDCSHIGFEGQYEVKWQNQCQI